ncbi:HEPN domain-containing protein [Streptomyces sp. NPDC059371]|uniref:HEPN domain-containing protein n=1 Tax=Streptomyces sp. NPDC059371 TaxID=3346812 RepID=UPI0036887421
MAYMHLGAHIGHPCRRSRRIVILQSRISQLASSLSISKNLVSQSQADTDRLHAFRVLMHAEVQHYVESIARNVLDVTERQCRLGRLTHAGHHLLIFQSLNPLANTRSSGNASYPDFSPDGLQRSWSTTASSLTKAIEAHRKRIAQNNGIKPSNLNVVLIPLGFRDTFFTQHFRDKMNELGEKRGQVAHGAGALIPTIPTGAGELNRFHVIEPGLSDMDRYAPRVLIPAWR